MFCSMKVLKYMLYMPRIANSSLQKPKAIHVSLTGKARDTKNQSQTNTNNEDFFTPTQDF